MLKQIICANRCNLRNLWLLFLVSLFNLSNAVTGARIKASMEKLRGFCQTFGLHPITALGMFAVDWLLFGEEVATLGVGWLISIPVGMVLGLIAYLIQKHAYKDETPQALGKALLVGLLTAIPAPISSMGLLPLAAFGAIKAMTPKRRALPEGTVEP